METEKSRGREVHYQQKRSIGNAYTEEKRRITSGQNAVELDNEGIKVSPPFFVPSAKENNLRERDTDEGSILPLNIPLQNITVVQNESNRETRSSVSHRQNALTPKVPHTTAH